MTVRKKNPTSSKKKDAKGKDSSASATKDSVRTVYKGFSIWTDTKRPSWHPIKKMRYVFFRMISGCTVTDAIKEIRWSASEFWHLVDLNRHAPFREEYQRAKKLQGRAFADSILAIAEGRDRTTKRSLKKMAILLKKGLKNARGQKSPMAMKMIIESLISRADENDGKIISRNKLQIDAAKWLAKTSNPLEFGEKSAVSLGSPSGDGDDVQRPVLVQFVGPDGKVTDL